MTSLFEDPSRRHELRGHFLEYSIESSGLALMSCLPSMGYSANSFSEIASAMEITHEKYPKIEWLNVQVKKVGLLGTAKEIKASSAKGSVYLHFLAIEGLIKLGFYDYFCTNPTTIAKIDRWLSPFEEEMGITEFDRVLREIASKAENRNVNLERQSRLAHRIGFYLVIRYNLHNIHCLTAEQWQGFVLDCRAHSRTTKIGYVNNLASISLMHSALFNMGVLNEPYNRNSAGVKSIVKSRAFLDAPDFGAFAASFLSMAESTKEQGTVHQYRTTLEMFHQYLVGRHGEDFKIAMLKRAHVVEFITFLFEKKKNEGLSHNWLEGRSLCVKVFLRYISENAKAYEREGLSVFKSKIIVDADFRTPTVTNLPRPLEKETREALLNTLQRVPSPRYRLMFLLMLTTGLAKGDAAILKYECMTHDQIANTYTLSFWRKKVKKEGRVKLMPQVPAIIEKLQEMNTQLIPSPHPDGTCAIYLLNDAGKRIGTQWFDYWLRVHKALAAEAHQTLSSFIKDITPHQLRHTFASMLREGGADIMQIMELLLHENINTTAKYTKESDVAKLQMVQKLIEGQYTCDAYPGIDQEFLRSEEGQTLVNNVVRFENRFTYGRCTANGAENCKRAYRCLTCTFLCSTMDDLPEMLNSLKIQHLQYKELSIRFATETNEERGKSMSFELNRMKERLRVVIGKVQKLQAVIKMPAAEPNVLHDCDDILTFF